MTSCVEDRGFTSSIDLRWAGFRLGRSMNIAVRRGDQEAKFSRGIVLPHALRFAQDCPETELQTLQDACKAIGAGAGMIGGSEFWPILLQSARAKISAIKMSRIESTASEIGQLNLASWADREANLRNRMNRPRLLAMPNVGAYLNSLRLHGG